jgi:hypothetical protein
VAKSAAGQHESRQELRLDADLVVRLVPIAELREQDVNAQIMQPRHFDRLVENIKERGQVESLPYVHRPGDEGPYVIISGHHRVRAARQAGLKEIPCMVELRELRRSQVVAKQIAHNELHGDPDKEILARLIVEIDDAGDLLSTGLDPDLLPTVDEEAPTLINPHVEYDWRMVTLVFLPEQLAGLDDLVKLIESKTELLGVAERSQFAEFSTAVLNYGRAYNIRSMATTISMLVELAHREIAAAAMDTAAAG